MDSISKVQTDYLIVGQGLAGSLLALILLQRGKTVRVIDNGHRFAASKIAGGLINPITGRRHVLTWRFLDFWKSLDLYDAWSSKLGTNLFYQKPLLRFMGNPEERRVFERKLNAGAYGGVDIAYPAQAESIPRCKLRKPCYRLQQAGYVDQAKLIQVVAGFLKSRNCWVQGTWGEKEFSRSPGRVKWKQWEASTIIFTQGFKGDTNPFFRQLPFRNAKGEIVEITGPDFYALPVLNCGKWLLPIGGGRYRGGATYDLETLDQIVTLEGVSDILDGLAGMVDWDLQIIQAQAGVRPAMHDFKPVMGRHPWFPELVIFNGLGSKGSLQAPLLATELVNYLEDGVPLHPEADVERFRKYL